MLGSRGPPKALGDQVNEETSTNTHPILLAQHSILVTSAWRLVCCSVFGFNYASCLRGPTIRGVPTSSKDIHIPTFLPDSDKRPIPLIIYFDRTVRHSVLRTLSKRSSLRGSPTRLIGASVGYGWRGTCSSFVLGVRRSGCRVHSRHRRSSWRVEKERYRAGSGRARAAVARPRIISLGRLSSFSRRGLPWVYYLSRALAEVCLVPGGSQRLLDLHCLLELDEDWIV